MKTFRRYGIRIPEGWKIKGPHPLCPNCASPHTKTIHLEEPSNLETPYYAALAHESMHARLFEKGLPFNCDENMVEHELKAFVYQLHTVYKRKSKLTMKQLLNLYSLTASGIIGNRVHQSASRKLQKSNLWRRCQAFAGE